MIVNIENMSGERFDFRGYRKLIELVVETVEKDKKLPGDMEVNVLITDKDSIKKVNKETRGINRITDVLSFPYFSFEKPGIFDPEDGLDPEAILGDIILCAEKIKEQAARFGHSQKREMAYLTLHSMLHLTGYDHMTPDDERLMNAEADRLIDIIGIGR